MGKKDELILENLIEKIDNFLCNAGDYIYHDYDISCDNNIEAKQVLIDFLNSFSTLKTSKEYKQSEYHFRYLLQLIPIDQYCKKKKYLNACHEITSLHHYTYMLQGEVFYNLINVLKKYLYEEC